MTKRLRNVAFLSFLCASLLSTSWTVAGGTELSGLTHGYYCAGVCDSHTGDQCPSPPPFWYQCVNECLAAGCNFNLECVENGILEAEEWCENQ
jgi:hypothetical protein